MLTIPNAVLYLERQRVHSLAAVERRRSCLTDLGLRAQAAELEAAAARPKNFKTLASIHEDAGDRRHTRARVAAAAEEEEEEAEESDAGSEDEGTSEQEEHGADMAPTRPRRVSSVPECR
jgi:hypothetical protein